MTHKNPNLRAGNVVKHVDKKETPTKSYGKPVAADKPPRMEMDGKKWNVEFFKDRQDLQINEIEVNQSVYVYKCQGSTIKVNGKCNNIIILWVLLFKQDRTNLLAELTFCRCVFKLSNNLTPVNVWTNTRPSALVTPEDLRLLSLRSRGLESGVSYVD